MGSPSWRWRIAGGGPGWAASSVPIRCQAKKPLCSPRSVASAVGLRVLQPGAWQSCGQRAPPGGHEGKEAEPGPVPGLQAPRVEGTPALVHTEPPHRAHSTPPSGREACPCKVCSEEGWAPKSSFLDAKLNPGKTTARRNTNARLFYVNRGEAVHAATSGWGWRGAGGAGPSGPLPPRRPQWGGAAALVRTWASPHVRALRGSGRGPPAQRPAPHSHC